LKWGLCCWVCANCCCCSNPRSEIPIVEFIFPNGETFESSGFVEISSQVILQFQCCKNQLFCNFFMICWLLHPSPSCQEKEPIVEEEIHTLEFMYEM
jgi:hypothetical protein